MNTFAFTTVDFIVIGIIALSAILGLVRGFVREAISLLGFLLAMYFAYRYTAVFAEKFFSSIPGGVTAQHVAAFIALFVGILILSKIIANLFNRLISTVGLSFFDRLLGAVFGILRGTLIVVVLSTLFALTDLPKSSEWKDALTKPAIEMVVGFIRSWLPEDWANQLKNATDIRQVP
jgi:membrane protein required for colicin V production